MFLMLSFLGLLSLLGYIVYWRYKANQRLDRMALLNLLTEEEKAHYINEYKKVITAHLVYQLIAEKKLDIETAHEIVKERRNK